MSNNDATVFNRLTDTSKYTGSHKERFDANGQGKGKAGREELVKNTGSTSSATRDHTIDNTAPVKGNKPVVKPKTEQETYGLKPNKVTIFVYADKHHNGENLVLTKQKFPSWKQVDAALTKLIPTGKPKILVDPQLKQVKTLEQLQDGGKYMSITAADFAKIDKSKVPAAFSN